MQLFGAFRQRKRTRRLALVIQIDNLPHLEQRLGLTETAAFLGALSGQIGTLLNIAPPAATGTLGQIAVVVSLAGDAAVRQKAAGLRSLVRSWRSAVSGVFLPELRVVLMLGSSAQPDAVLLEAARRHLFAATGSQDIVFQSFPKEPTATPRLEPNAVQLRCQPQLCCHTGLVTGFDLTADIESTCGWRPQRDRLPAEEQHQFTQLILAKGLDSLSYWKNAGFDIDRVVLHASAVDLSVPHFADLVLWELDRKDTSPARLSVAIGEDALSHHMISITQKALSRLADLGCGIDLLGFGVGHGTLDALRRLPVRRVRIDASFITRCDRDESQQRMILAILALADRVGIEVLADGVATPAAHTFLAQLGCSTVQGTAIAPPMPLGETLDFLFRQRTQTQSLPVIRRRA